MEIFWYLFGVVSVSFVLGGLIGYKLKDFKLEEDLWE